jgi:dCTP deaminase
MILSDREIRAAFRRDFLRITPLPPPEAWSSTAVDLTLASTLRRWSLASGGGLALASPEFDFQALIEQYTQAIDVAEHGYALGPGEFVLGWTIERIRLPFHSRIAARVEGKSSLARLGLGVHVTAPTVHAGFGFKETVPDHPGTPLQLEI